MGRWQHECDVALGAVREAAVLARTLRQQIGASAIRKADQSPVTVADFAVQALVAHRLASAFPDDPLVAEEDAAWLRSPEARPTFQSVVEALHRVEPDLGPDQVFEAIDRGRGAPSERFWTLDPVDGTKGFIRGDHYVVALALVVRGRVELGLMGCPQLSLMERPPGIVGSIVYAIRGQGAFCASMAEEEITRLAVSHVRAPRLARVLRSFEVEHIDQTTFDHVLRTLRVEVGPTLMDSQAKHAMVAAGRADLLIRLPAAEGYCEKIWDQAAGALLIEEAGGRVTDRHGEPLDFACGRTLARNVGVIASNGRLHEAVIDALRTRGVVSDPDPDASSGR